MALLDNADGNMLQISILLGAILGAASLLVYLFSRPSFPKDAPRLTSDSWPILGSPTFFSKRWEFFRDAVARSKTGNFSFYVGQLPVIGLWGQEERKLFFEHRGLNFGEGYGALFAAAPEVKRDNNPLGKDETRGDDFNNYFQRRLVALLKGPVLKRNLPTLLKDARANLDSLGSSGTTDPFDSIYRMVFQFTMRTVACNEIADDPPLLSRCLSLYETVENAADQWMIMFPWMPLLSKARRTYASAQLYMIFKKVVDDRKRHGRHEEDALQFLIDQGDDLTKIITFVLGSLFAGQLNSGINAAYILCYLAKHPDWIERVREEVTDVADKYCSDQSLPLKDRLMQVPIEAWEGEFPMIDLCLKDTIRLQMAGASFRKNTSGHAIPLKNGEVIPPGAYVAYHVNELHRNPEIYADVDKWDPARYLPERAEDKKQQYAWMGWGLARHPCLGMRFAKLENNLIVAMFVAYFHDVYVSDRYGNPAEIPPPNENNLTAHKPDTPVYLTYKA
ncbi:cytochrome P450 6A1 [Lecanosticta acicola]|uniref:Cytochrome P450 6A1 n=1 Tax=Lecanosticta acicola TaxID=111012 RepID=A0AAI9EFC7_9PEZI|nr:cytochrome P450 6A1 [Lecanosticta acicola]